METLFQEIYDIFFNKIIHDKDFFKYSNVITEEAMEIARQRSQFLLIESISRLTLNCTPDIDFNNYDLETKKFGFLLTKNEIDLLTSLMKEKLLEQDELKLKVMTNRFSTKDINYHSPANERKTFMDMYKEVVGQNDKAIDNYASRDRITGKYKQLKFEYE